MKKVVRMLGLCALVALAFTSCKKKDTNSVTFTASMCQPTTDVRTHGEMSTDGFSNSYFLVWDNKDQIKVVNPTATAAESFTVENGEGTKDATFVVSGDKADFIAELETATYTAFYPAANFDDAAQTVTLKIKDEQELMLGRTFGDESYPMYGTNTGTNFEFTSDAGFLTFTFGAELNKPVSFNKVVLTAKGGTKLAGDIVYTYDGSGGYTYEFNGTSSTITLERTELVTASFGQAAIVNFILPKGVIPNGFDVTLYNNGAVVQTFECTVSNTIVEKKFTNMPEVTLQQP
jgi:hypothetical protein